MKKFTSFLLLLVMFGNLIVPMSVCAYNTGNDYPSDYQRHTYYSTYYGNYRKGVTPWGTGIADKYNFYTRECTSFVAWCLNTRNGVPFNNWYGGVRWGNAQYWGSVARKLGYVVNKTPAPGAVAWWNSGTYGHVAWVKSVSGNQITIEEYNTPAYSGKYNTRTISANSPSGYIHIKDLGTQIKPSKPSAPSYVNISSANIGIGDKISVNWGGVSGATGYDVTLNCTTNSAYTQKTSVTGTSTTFILNNVGTYNVSVSAKNSAGNSSATKSGQTVVHPNCIITFKDYDNSILETKSVKYNGTVTPPLAPSREGYTFQNWNQSLSNITSDKTIVAVYAINTYSVKFVDNEGKVLSNQRIEYKSAATPPEDPAPPIGYKFVGWDKKDYEEVKKDLTITAVFTWENKDLPIVATIKSAKRNTAASGYEVDVELLNFPDSLTRGKVIAMLKTEAGKMVASETETFNLAADTITSKSIYIPYSGVATIADISVVGVIDDENTGVPIANSATATIDLGLQWSDWSTNQPPDGDYIVESKKEYRYKDKQTTTSSSNTMSGWTKYDSKITSWGNWSGWQNTAVSASNTRQVQTRWINPTYQTRWTYYRWITGKNGNSSWTQYNSSYYKQSIDLSYRLSVKGTYSSHTRYGSYGSSRDSYGTYLKDWWWGESSYQKQTAAGYTQYSYRDAIFTHYFYKWDDWSEWQTDEVAASDTKQVESRTVYRFKSNDIKIPSYNYKRYKYQNLNNGNYYYTYSSAYADSMGYPGEWEYNKSYSELTKIATVEDGVELYGGYGEDSWYKADINTSGIITTYIIYDTLEDTSGKTYTISGKANAANKKATLMVYKGTNTDPTASQLEYVEQITLDENGEYSFNFNPKEIPSIKTGDFVAVLGIEGATAPIYIDTIYAPKPTYKVDFVNEDGTLIETQTVIEGESAKVPDKIPEKEGYDFVGWDTGVTNIHADLIIKAQFKKKTFNVVFVDWENNDIEIKTFEYGDSLEGPTPKDKEGSTFIGWDKVLDGILTVTENMIVAAEYKLNDYTITFINWNGEVIDTQVLKYGEEAVFPENPSKENMVFAGWSDSQALLFACEDITVYPIFEFTETCSNPTASIKSGSYVGTQSVALNCTTPDSVIYYSLFDGDAETFDDMNAANSEWFEYTEPFEISDSTSVVFYASANEMNNSPYQIEEYTILGKFNLEITGSTLKHINGNISGKLYYNIVGEGNPTNAVPILVIQSNDGKLVYMKSGEAIELVAGDNVGAFSNINFSDTCDDGYTIKLLLWKSIDSLNPLSKEDILVLE